MTPLSTLPQSPAQHRTNSLAQSFVTHYHGRAKRNAVEAARLAGYKRPEIQGPAVARRYADLLAKAEAEQARAKQASEAEVMERLTAIVRDPKHRDHLRAIELALRVQGKLSEKLDITLDKTQILKEIQGFLRMRAGASKEAVLPIDLKPLALSASSSEG